MKKSSAPVLLHVLSGLEIGGKERIAIDLAQRARQEGVDARLLLFDTPFRDAQRDLDPGDIPLHFLARGPGLDRRFVLQLRQLIRHEGVQQLHAHNETAIVYCALANRLTRILAGARPRPGRPSVCGTYHTYPGHDSTRGRRLARFAARYVDTIAAVSAPLRERLRDAGWVREAEVIWNGVDLATFQPRRSPEPAPPATTASDWRRRLGLRPGQRLVGHVARFDPIKRQEDLIDAAALLAGTEDSPVFVLVGLGADLPRIQGLVETRGLSNVRFVPSLPDVAAFLRELDLFVLCSSYEAAPLALLEAMACGLPIVATGVGGIPDIVDDGATGPCAELVSALNPHELAQAIGRLLEDPARRTALGSRARERAGQYSSERAWQRYREIYRLTSVAGHGADVDPQA